MVEKPLLASDIYAKYVGEDGDVTWPEDPAERMLLARALYGRELIGDFDYWLDHAIDLIENPEPARPFERENELSRKDRYFREHLSTLTDDQKRAVRNLVRSTVHGAIFSMLVNVDQSGNGDYKLTLSPRYTDLTVLIAPDPPNDLHDELDDWILSFSKFADEILGLREGKWGWEFYFKEFYKE